MAKYINEYRNQRKRIQSLLSSYRRKGYDIEYSLPAIPKRITQGSVNRLAKVTAKYLSEKVFAPNLDTGEVITLKEFRNRGFHRRKVDLNEEVYKYYYGDVPSTPDVGEAAAIPDVGEAAAIPDVGEAPPIPGVEPIPDGYYKKEESPPPLYSDVIIDAFENLIAQYPPRAYEIVFNFYEGIKAKVDRETLAEWLQDTNEAGLWMTPEEAYYIERLYNNLGEMFKMLDISAGEMNDILSELDMENDFYGEIYE